MVNKITAIICFVDTLISNSKVAAHIPLISSVLREIFSKSAGILFSLKLNKLNNVAK